MAFLRDKKASASHAHDHPGHDHGVGGHSHAGHAHIPADFGGAFVIGITLNVIYVVAQAVFGWQDFLRADAGTHHREVISPDGCLALLILCPEFLGLAQDHADSHC